MDYDLEARQRLGRAVRQARRAAGYAKTVAWVDAVGRSDRVLLGLERGEPAGSDTYAAVAQALHWDLEYLYRILGGLDTAHIVPASSPSALAEASDEEIAAEVLRRMKAGEGSGRDPAPMNSDNGVLLTREEHDRLAAAQRGNPDDAGKVEKLAADERRRQLGDEN